MEYVIGAIVVLACLGAAKDALFGSSSAASVETDPEIRISHRFITDEPRRHSAFTSSPDICDIRNMGSD
jgi:ribose 1,5-bisphosphokinase PhnN